MTIIGFAGYVGAGKNAIGDEVAWLLGYPTKAFADPLRDMVWDLNPMLTSRFSSKRLQDVWDKDGTDPSKLSYADLKTSRYGDEFRRLLQRFGTEVGRKHLGGDIWVDLTLKDVTDAVVTDARFPNEVSTIRERDGLVVWVDRPGVGPANAHASENSIDSSCADLVILNDGPLSSVIDLAGDVVTWAREHGYLDGV